MLGLSFLQMCAVNALAISTNRLQIAPKRRTPSELTEQHQSRIVQQVHVAVARVQLMAAAAVAGCRCSSEPPHGRIVGVGRVHSHVCCDDVTRRPRCASTNPKMRHVHRSPKKRLQLPAPVMGPKCMRSIRYCSKQMIQCGLIHPT